MFQGKIGNKETREIRVFSDLFLFSLNSLSVWVPHNSSKTSIGVSDFPVAGGPLLGGCWDLFYSKTNGFSNWDPESVARCWLLVNGFATFWNENILKLTLFQHF